MITLPSAAAAKKKPKKIPARLDVVPPDEEGGAAADDNEALLEGDVYNPTFLPFWRVCFLVGLSFDNLGLG